MVPAVHAPKSKVFILNLSFNFFFYYLFFFLFWVDVT